MNRAPEAAAPVANPYVLAIDIGSSSVRVLLYDRTARVVAGVGAHLPIDLRTSVAGASEIDADQLLANVAHCIDAVVAQAPIPSGQIAGVAVDTFVSNLLAIDSDGQPLTPVITYADTRNAAEAEHLRQLLDEATLHERTGCLLRTSYWPARLAWLQRTQPDMWRKAARWITFGEYLELRLFGHCRVSYSAASWSGLLDRKALAWDLGLRQQVGIDARQLSPLVDCDAPLSGLREPYASRWPLLKAVPWFPAVGDGAAANVGSGCVGPRRVALTLGTTGAMRVALPAVAQVPAGLWCYRVNGQYALLGGATSEGGNVYAWLSETLRLSDPAAVEAAVAAIPPDGHGLTVLPFWAGERSPNWAGNVQATIHGLTLATTPVAILRASLEAVAYRFALIEQRIFTDRTGSYQLIASGGALQRSPAWSQIFADVLNHPVVISAEPEATSRGAALLALQALGVLTSLDAAPAADGPIFTPDPVRHEVYQAAIARQQTLYQQLIEQAASKA